MTNQIQPANVPDKRDLWRKWYSGLDNDDQTLRSVYASLPFPDPDSTEQLAQIFDHPVSPYLALGEAAPRNHDCLRIVLGRGLLNQDEAFILGYACGTTAKQLEEPSVQAFRRACKRLCKPPYRMSDADLIAFDVGFARGQKAHVRNAARFDFAAAMALELGQIRTSLGIKAKALKASFREERLRLPGSHASTRLAVI